jgi:fatty-acyl-CoA synthase
MNDWLERRAQLSPERVALVDAVRGDRRVTWAEWNAVANRTAQLLRELGIVRGERVAVLAMNCTEVLDLLFACGKLGAILQPLNWRLGASELARALRDTEPALLVYGPDFREQAQALRAQVPTLKHLVALEPAEGVLAFSERDGLPDSPPPRISLGPSDPWVLCPTGGSTGIPKAAVLTHGSITANAQNTLVSWGLSCADIALLNAPLFHTGGLNVFTTPLVYVGGTSVVCRSFQVEEVFDRVERGQVSLLFGVPTMFIEMQRHPRFAQIDFARLKLMISGGAPCPLPVFARFFENAVDFRTGYGLTEAGPNTFFLPTHLVREKPGAVGYPLWHVEVRIEGAPDEGPAGPGELLVRGPHLFAGYWGKPEESARALEGGWLHTGDLANRDEDGCYWIVGRAKDLIISGGENIYPAEVENVLAAHPAVAEVAVIGVPDPKWGELPRAVVVCRPGLTLDEEEARNFCRERLARYKAPRSVVKVESLPRTAAGKLDRRAVAEVHGKRVPAAR